jgi:fucose 4-O-acetylase-like acetyltransferase
MWFLLCLFVTELLFYAISSAYRDTKKLVVSLVVFSIIGFLYSRIVTVPLACSIDVAPTAIVFYGAGYLVNRYKTLHTVDSFVNLKVIVLLLLVINFVAGFAHGRIDMYDNTYHNYFLFYVAAFSGIGWFVMLMKIIKPTRIFTYIGTSSIVYLILHQQIIFPIIGKVLPYSPWLNNYLKGHAMLDGVFWTISTIIICIPIIYAINNKLYFLLGKSGP